MYVLSGCLSMRNQVPNIALRDLFDGMLFENGFASLLYWTHYLLT